MYVALANIEKVQKNKEENKCHPESDHDRSYFSVFPSCFFPYMICVLCKWSHNKYSIFIGDKLAPGPPDGLQYDAPASNNLQCIKPTLRHRWDEGISQMTPYETIREKSEVRVCCRCGRQGGVAGNVWISRDWKRDNRKDMKTVVLDLKGSHL